MSSVLAKNPSPDINGLSFETVFEGYFDYVSHTLRCLGVHVSDLEDVVHDVFVQVYRHYAQYDVTRPIKPWLYCFAYRSARDYRGSARVRRVVAKDEILEEDSAPGPEAQAIAQQARRLAMVALDGLTSDERDVFVGMVLDELSAPEMAEILGVPLNTVYSRLRRARSRFDDLVQRMGANARVR